MQSCDQLRPRIVVQCISLQMMPWFYQLWSLIFDSSAKDCSALKLFRMRWSIFLSFCFWWNIVVNVTIRIEVDANHKYSFFFLVAITFLNHVFPLCIFYLTQIHVFFYLLFLNIKNYLLFFLKITLNTLFGLFLIGVNTLFGFFLIGVKYDSNVKI